VQCKKKNISLLCLILELLPFVNFFYTFLCLKPSWGASPGSTGSCFSGNNSFSGCTFWLNESKFHFINYLCLYFSLYLFIYFILLIPFFLLLEMFVTTAPLEHLWKKYIDIYKVLYSSRVFFLYEWIKKMYCYVSTQFLNAHWSVLHIMV
jgi:hypothetical protein